MGDKTQGVYGKFEVRSPSSYYGHNLTSRGGTVGVKRTDGKSRRGQKHHRCNYFLLDLDHASGREKAALDAYADACEAEYPLLAEDIRNDALGDHEFFILDLTHDPFAPVAMTAFERWSLSDKGDQADV